MIEAYGALILEALGFDAPSLTSLARRPKKPTACCCDFHRFGKTTTLYAALTEIHNGRDKIITIGPVEYQLPSILQSPSMKKS